MSRETSEAGPYRIMYNRRMETGYQTRRWKKHINTHARTHAGIRQEEETVTRFQSTTLTKS